MLAACKKGDVEIAKLLINAGAHVHMADKVFSHLFLFSIFCNWTLKYLLVAYLKGDVEIVKLLIDVGGDVNKADKVF